MLRIIQIPLLLLIGWLGGGTWYWVCQVRGLCGDAEGTANVAAAAPKAKPEPMFAVLDQGQPRFEAEAHLRFAAHQAAGVIPADVAAQLDAVAAFLRAHPARELQLIGLAHRNEQATDGQPLALRRAIFLAEALIERGVNPDQLIRLPKRLPTELTHDTLVGGVELTLLAPVVAAAETEEPDSAAQAAPLAPPPHRNVYFGSNQSDLALSDAERAYLTQAIQYMHSQPGSRLRLTGHTDNQGSHAHNQALGLARAETVKGFLVSFGLAPSRIELASQGERQPIATNDTPKGRQQNRRVDIEVLSP